MKEFSRIGLFLFAGLVFLSMMSGCASSSGTASDEGVVAENTALPGVLDSDATVEEVLEWSKQNLPDSDVLTVRLTSTHPSESHPVIRLDTEDVLTLQFDLPGVAGKLYTIRFFLASKDWERSTEPEPDAPPLPDEIFDYRTSIGMDLPYVHYFYEFPNSHTRFQRSGNYVLEVFDDRTGDVLFDRRFCVTDAEFGIDVQASSYSLITAEPDELVPEARVNFPVDPWWTQDDCQVCFVKNGWVNKSTCLDNPRIEGSIHVYEVPRPFPLTIPVHHADLETVMEDVLRRDEVTIPPTVILFADDHRILSSQDYRYASPVPKAGILDKDAATPYVFVQFSLINAPGGGGVRAPYLVGTFNDWEVDPSLQMKWDAREQYYYLNTLLREGEIFYSYFWEDEENVPTVSKFEGPSLVSYTAFVYARDSRYPTDRLLAVQGATIRGK